MRSITIRESIGNIHSSKKPPIRISFSCLCCWNNGPGVRSFIVFILLSLRISLSLSSGIVCFLFIIIIDLFLVKQKSRIAKIRCNGLYMSVFLFFFCCSIFFLYNSNHKENTHTHNKKKHATEEKNKRTKENNVNKTWTTGGDKRWSP
jgi:Ca2+/Na+ antiporter